MTKQELYNNLVTSKVLFSSALKRAFQKVDRADFVRPEYSDFAYNNHPLPIGFGQSISQPFVVAFMLELLEPKLGEVILDLGAGSGWTQSLLAELVGPKGRVFGVEVIPELLIFAKKNLQKYSYKNIILRQAGQRLGLPEFSPFQKILVSAEAQDLPATLVDQLAIGGTLVMPIQQAVVKVDKISDSHCETATFPGFAFVPLLIN